MIKTRYCVGFFSVTLLYTCKYCNEIDMLILPLADCKRYSRAATKGKKGNTFANNIGEICKR